MKGPRQRRPAQGKDDKGLARIAGLSAVSALFANGPERVERLFFNERAKAQVKAFYGELARARKPYRQVEAKELARIAGTPMHGGVVAIARSLPVLPLDAARARTWAQDGKLLLMLDGVGNPHNLGAIVRTAAFFGVPRIVLSDHPAQAAPSDASYRVAEGGFEFVRLFRTEGIAAALMTLRGAYRVVGAAPGKHTPPSALRQAGKPVALILGNEEDGLLRATLNACDDIVAIPGAGRVQSLNVAATAAILIHALTQG